MTFFSPPKFPLAAIQGLSLWSGSVMVENTHKICKVDLDWKSYVTIFLITLTYYMDTGLDLFTDISLTMFFILFIKKRAARLTFLLHMFI